MIHFVQSMQRAPSLRLLAIVLAWTLLAGAAAVRVSDPGRPIRLELLSHHRVREIGLTSAADFHLEMGGQPQTLPGPLRIAWQAKAFVVESGGKARTIPARHITVTSDAPMTIAVGTRSAPIGTTLELRRTARGLQLIAALPLEDYLRGIVTGEGGDMPAQALRAMAVLARTWALENRGRHRRNGFDFCSSTHCEVWPLRRPSARAVEAVEQTRGEVLTYHSRLAEVFYSADCGGTTAPGNSFSERGKPYLTSRADPWCAWSPQTNWTTTIAKSRLTPLLIEAGWLNSPQHSWRLEVLRRDASGRVSALVLSGAAARVIQGRDFRFLVDRSLGWNQIKSTLFDVADEGSTLRFTGHGLGHGAGLCEAGAEGMAHAGRNYRQILAFYFPGTTLLTLPASPKAAHLQSGSARPHPLYLPAAWQERASSPGWHYATSGPCHVMYWGRLPQAVLDLCPRLVDKAERRTGLPLTSPLHLIAYPTAAAFIASTGRPGWVAAATRGQSIALMPLPLIERQRRLSDVLRHEILHVLISDHAAPGTSLCLQEGAVLYFSGEAQELPQPQEMNDARTWDRILQAPRSADDLNQALAACATRAHTIVQQDGETALLQRVEHGR